MKKASLVNSRNIVRKVRDFYGLSQLQLAKHLKVNRSLLNMAERDERGLPYEVHMNLSRLSDLIPENGSAEKPVIRMDEEMTSQLDLQKHEIKQVATIRYHHCKLKLSKMQRALDHLNEKRTSCIKLHAVLPALKENLSPCDDELIALLEQNISRMHFNFGLEKQVLLEAQLAGLQAEIEFLKEHLPEEK